MLRHTVPWKPKFLKNKQTNISCAKILTTQWENVLMIKFVIWFEKLSTRATRMKFPAVWGFIQDNLALVSCGLYNALWEKHMCPMNCVKKKNLLVTAPNWSILPHSENLGHMFLQKRINHLLHATLVYGNNCTFPSNYRTLVCNQYNLNFYQWTNLASIGQSFKKSQG